MATAVPTDADAAGRLIAAARQCPRLHLGCGTNVMPGWVNVDDLEAPGVVSWDLRKPLPLADGSIEYIFAEHFIEHILVAEAEALLRVCRRLLKPGGVLRLSTPDLRWLIWKYLTRGLKEWRDVGWLPGTPCGLLNEGMRSWGHHYLYDKAELAGLIERAGFPKPVSVRWRKSKHHALHNLECRPYHRELIFEATAPHPTG